LSASGAVRETRLRAMRGPVAHSAASVLAAPWLAAGVLWLLQQACGGAEWPWWWTLVLALAWAPLLWLPTWRGRAAGALAWRAAVGLGLVAALGLAAQFAHRLALGVQDQPWQPAGWVALIGMGLLYLGLALLQLRPGALSGWRRWSYAGFYTDEVYTRAALRLWPARWTPRTRSRDMAARAVAWSSK
ncbi:MAG: NADH-quinone oxidoreductase subunit L, partial [Betaproteobacteria bacterium]|nr:NADH-quinone oxidoreductase subunit L [Betaproteobacteria bacterium]